MKPALWFAIAVGAVLVVRSYWRAAGESEEARKANRNPYAVKHDLWESGHWHDVFDMDGEE